jgi:hypothetical protein
MNKERDNNKNAKGAELLMLKEQFEKHFYILKIEYPSITREALLKGLEIYEPIREMYGTT